MKNAQLVVKDMKNDIFGIFEKKSKVGQNGTQVGQNGTPGKSSIKKFLVA